MHYSLIVWFSVAGMVMFMLRAGLETNARNQRLWAIGLAAAWPLIIVYALVGAVALLLSGDKGYR